MVISRLTGEFFNSVANRIGFLAALLVAAGCSDVRASQSVSLAWDPSPDISVAGYMVRYGDASGVYTSSLDVGKSTSTVIPGPLDGATYYIVVTAYNSTATESSPSNEVTHNSSAAGVQSVTLAWNANSDASVVGYILHYGNASGVYTNSIDAANSTSVAVPGLQPGASYYLVVTAYNSARQESVHSNEVAYQAPDVIQNTGPSLQMTMGSQPADPVLFRFLGLPNQTYEIQATEDFNTWSTIWYTLPLAASQLLEYADTNTTESGRRFYRLVTH
jgi:hypothetical protein